MPDMLSQVPGQLPRLVPLAPQVLRARDVEILVKLARAEIAAGIAEGKSTEAALAVLNVLARVEAWLQEALPKEAQDANRSTSTGPTGA
jgi:hypothetical protein